MLDARIMASGLSATASTMGFKIGLINGFVSDSGSFSQSNNVPSASGVGIVAGSDMYSLSASLMSKLIVLMVAATLRRVQCHRSMRCESKSLMEEKKNKRSANLELIHEPTFSRSLRENTSTKVLCDR